MSPIPLNWRWQTLLWAGLYAAFGGGASPLLAADWHTDLATAQAEARDRHLPLLIHVYSRNCGPCRTMEHEVFSSPAFDQATINQFVLLKLDTGRQRAVAENLGVTSLPSDLVMSPEGRVVFRREGFHPGGGRAYLDSLARHRGQANPQSEPPAVATGSGMAAPDRASMNGAPQPRSALPVTQPRAVSVQEGATGKRTMASQSTTESQSPRLTSGTARVTANQAGDAEGWLPPQRRDAGSGARPKPEEEPLSVQPLTDPQWGLEGYCPVTLKLAGRWQIGSESFVARFEGRQYKLADRHALEAFQRDPAAHAPQAGGADLVLFESSGRSVPGSTQFAAYFNGQLYLFSSRESRTAFQRNPARYARGREGALRIQFERLAGKIPLPAV